MRGTVAWFSNGKGYGFISPTGGGRDVFVHHTAVVMEGYRFLQQGESVDFEIEASGPNNKPLAINVRRMEGHNGNHPS